MKVWSLGRFDQQIGQPARILLWLDVEGSELAVLRSARRYLLPSGRIRWINRDPRDLHAFLTANGFVWRLQANAEGDLSERARQRAAELANDAELRVTAPRPPKPTANAAEWTTIVATTIQASRVLMPDNVLQREYKGRTIRVTVLANGFEFDGVRYKSLTAVAKAVTGKHWNGFHFFNLRKNEGEAQRDAGEAYIKSQQHEGWVCSPTQYDDGGVTGANMDRPALRRLLADIEAGKIDCVVVYKVDRLSRSLFDFAKIMETFEQHNVSFVSVTQAFNTATSMFLPAAKRGRNAIAEKRLRPIAAMPSWKKQREVWRSFRDSQLAPKLVGR